jgi:hypothetical protein
LQTGQYIPGTPMRVRMRAFESGDYEFDCMQPVSGNAAPNNGLRTDNVATHIAATNDSAATDNGLAANSDCPFNTTARYIHHPCMVWLQNACTF